MSFRYTQDDVRSTDKEQLENTSDISAKMEQITLRDPGLQSALQERIDSCLEMGFETKDVFAATDELLLQGTSA